MPRKPLFQNLNQAEILDRLCSYEAIRQLVNEYCLLMDGRKLEDLVQLFIPDVKVSATTSGRDALLAEFQKLMTEVGTTILKVTTHSIDFESADSATGYVYSHGDIQMGGRWLHQAIRYKDKYQRLDDVWYFTSRKHQLWYSADVGTNPLSYPPANWPEKNVGMGDL